ncbi:OmpA family protein [Flavobacterium sp.]|jgi:OOP family OmpA-OmpF porin|uniref:OmpA family protein n=1 Tax=Flavobacterium sp. TaxID=239 RepID=UPI0037BFC48F
MKNRLLLLLTILCFSLAINAQKKNDKNKNNLELQAAEQDKELVGETFNRWSIEASFGQSKGSKPYTDGYYANNPGTFFGGIAINTFSLGARYMFSPKFGIKANVNIDNLQEQNGSGSLPFQMKHNQFTAEGVVNLTRLFDIQQQSGRFGLLFHFGFNVSSMTPGMGPQDKTEWNGGGVAGLSPQFRIFKNVSVFVDFTVNSNLRQHYNWDGTTFSDSNNNLTGSLVRTSIGLSVALGKGKIHGDWAIIKDKNDAKLDSLNKKIGEIEGLMNDSDKDGVPDYLDVENNSIAGVAVDTKGRMVDKNNNGVPDQLEKYVDNSISTNNDNNKNAINESMLEQFINEGYVAAYFDKNKRQPTNGSSDNIGFILNYLRNNPTKSVDIIGYADELGNTDYNNKLSSDRAQNVKDILVKSGIDASRLNIVGNGVDNSVDKNSEYARRLVRKVVFKIK